MHRDIPVQCTIRHGAPSAIHNGSLKLHPSVAGLGCWGIPSWSGAAAGRPLPGSGRFAPPVLVIVDVSSWLRPAVSERYPALQKWKNPCRETAGGTMAQCSHEIEIFLSISRYSRHLLQFQLQKDSEMQCVSDLSFAGTSL